MEFEDLQKMWNEEKNQMMYVFDQEALNRMIARRARGVNRVASINEWGLIIVAAVTAVTLLFIGSDGVYKILAAVTMCCTGAYVWWRRRRRLAGQEQGAATVLQELEGAIANAKYLVRFAQTFVYWFLLPTAAVTLFRMSQKETSMLSWVMISACFILAYALVQLELRWKHRPRLRRLEELREKLQSS